MLGLNSVLLEIDSLSAQGYEMDDFLDRVNSLLENSILTEAEYDKIVTHLKLEIMDVDRFISVNGCEQITNPVFFQRNNVPTDDGLLSNKIFGITKDDRAGIFAYIDLNGWYLDPSCYKTWIRMDRKIKDVIHGIDTYIVNDKGEIVPDPKGKNGVKFLKDNIDKIKFKTTESIKRDIKIQYLEKNKNRMFINKYIVIPPFYRDTNTGKGTVGVSGINTLYRNLILAVIGTQTTQDYGFDNSGVLQGRIQEILLAIYDWFSGNSNSTFSNIENGIGMQGKKGVLRMANMSKTTNYASRMVIAAPELKVETVDDMMVNLDKTALPLAACLANYRAYILYNVKRFFENEFLGNELYPIIKDNGKIDYVIPKDPLIEFSDEKIKREMDRFLHGYNNRFVPIEVPVEGDSKKKVYMQFKGRFKKPNDSSEPIYHRRLTWCDVFYMAAVEASKDKSILIVRYPMDSYFNQITTHVVVSSTKETEPMYIGDYYYPYYPKIREEDIGSDTGNMFVDTLKMSNLYLKGMGGDYDGDTVTAKSLYTIEANEELTEFMNSKANFIDLGGNNIRMVDADAVQSLYSLTKVLTTGKKITNPIFE